MVCALSVATSSIATEHNKSLTFSEKELDCLARNIYHESYGETHKGKRAVAYVTINRVLNDKYPNSICEVVKQKHQFEWVRMGKWSVNNKKAYKDALMIAFSVTINYDKSKDPTNGATMFHAKHAKPKWNWRKLVMTTRIGNHIFYKELA